MKSLFRVAAAAEVGWEEMLCGISIPLRPHCLRLLTLKLLRESACVCELVSV